MHALRRLPPILILAALTGCALPVRVPVGTARSGLDNKMVTAKDAPSTIWAVDGTICNVTGTRFQRIEVGDRIWCNWRQR